MEQLEMVLLHELAHVRRWDNLVNLLQRFVESLLFFHPVVWWLSGWVRLERELCCDRMVVERTGCARAYAEALRALSGRSQSGRVAAVAMAESNLAARIRRILNIDSNDRRAGLATVRRAAEVAGTIADEHQRNNARMWMVRKFARGGDVDAALRMVGELPESSLYQARALADVLGCLKHSQQPTMKEFLPRLLRTVASIPDPGAQATALQFIGDALADAGDVAGTQTIAEILRRGNLQSGLQNGSGHTFLHSEALVLSAIAKAQAESGNRQIAVDTFEKAVKLAAEMPPEGEGLRSGRLGRIAHDRVLAGDLEGALRTAELIVYEYHKAATLMGIAAAQAKAERRDEARALFRKAIQTANEIKIRDPLRDRAGSSYLNSHECLRTVAYVQATAGFAADAVETAETIDVLKWKNSAFALIAMAMANAGEIRPALRLVDRINDEKVKSSAMQDVAEGQAKAGDIQGAVAWAKSLATPEGRANALLGIVRAIAKSPTATD